MRSRGAPRVPPRPFRDGLGCRGGEIGAAEDPRTLRQGMDPEDLTGFCGAPEGLGGDVQKLCGFIQLHPGFDPVFGRLMYGDAVTRSRVQRLPLPVTRPLRFRMPAMRSSLAINTSWRTAAITSAEVLLR